jgi:hypothetical protein
MLAFMLTLLKKQVRDKHYGDWLNIWNELTQTAEKMDGYDLMIGNDAQMINTSGSGNNNTPAYTLYVPLQFWLNSVDQKSNLIK